jgi:SAM-dependent methyltransferase
MQVETGIKDRIQQYWSASAATYDDSFGHGLRSTEDKELWLDLLRRNIELPPDSRLLDVGSGTGFLSLLLAELGYRVTGIDLSPGMREQAARKAAEAGLSVEFLPGDAEMPCFEPGQFDGIISRHLLWTLPSPQLALVNWCRLVRPDGLVLVIDGVWTPRCLASRLSFLAADCLKLSRGKFGHLFWTRRYANKAELPFYGGAEPENVREAMEQAGLRGVWIDPMVEILAHERACGPLEYRITHGKNRRYLIGGTI